MSNNCQGYDCMEYIFTSTFPQMSSELQYSLIYKQVRLLLNWYGRGSGGGGGGQNL